MYTDTQQIEREQRTKATIFTLIYAAAVILLLLFYPLYRPNPLPSEVEIELDLSGDPNAGGGGGGTGASQAITKPVAQSNPPASTVNTNTEESPIVNKPIANTNTNINKPVTTNTKPANKPNPVNQNALFPGMGNEGEGNGDGTGKGDGKGTGTGTGTGSGNGPGNGPGTGPGNKPGIYGSGDYVLEGRACVSKPKIEDQISEEGKVVVNIWVDQNGTVTRTSVNESQTNTNSSQLRNIAMKAAKKTKWSANTNATVEQKGYIVYKFVLR